MTPLLCIDKCTLTRLREIEPMQFKQPLNNKVLDLAQGAMIPPVVDVLNSLHEQFLTRFPVQVDVKLVLDRDHLHSQAFNPLNQQPAGMLQSPGHREITSIIGGSHVWRQECELHSPVLIAQCTAPSLLRSAQFRKHAEVSTRSSLKRS